MARIFYYQATGNLYGVHPSGGVAPSVPDGIVWIEVPESPDSIVWPHPLGERGSRVNPTTLALEARSDVPMPIDRRGFEGALKTIFPDDLLTLRKVHILFYLTEHEEWPRLQKTILAAKTAGEITQTQYDAIKAEAAAKRIPVTLP